MNDLVKNALYLFLTKEIKATELEQIIYNSNEAESLLSEEEYFDLISFDYKSTEIFQFVKKVVRKKYGWFDFEIWRALKLLNEILEEKTDIVLSSRLLRKLYLEQENELGIPILNIKLAIGFESALDECPAVSEYSLWSPECLASKLSIVDFYRTDFLKSIEIEIKELRNLSIKKVDLASINSISEFHDKLRNELAFPEYYGKNWDAFWDTIIGIVDMPKILILYNWENFEVKFTIESERLKELIYDFNEAMKANKIIVQ